MRDCRERIEQIKNKDRKRRNLKGEVIVEGGKRGFRKRERLFRRVREQE